MFLFHKNFRKSLFNIYKSTTAHQSSVWNSSVHAVVLKLVLNFMKIKLSKDSLKRNGKKYFFFWIFSIFLLVRFLRYVSFLIRIKCITLFKNCIYSTYLIMPFSGCLFIPSTVTSKSNFIFKNCLNFFKNVKHFNQKPWKTYWPIFDELWRVAKRRFYRSKKEMCWF